MGGDSLSEMNQRLAPGLTIARSRIHGKGCFAAILFRQNQQIAEYVGERISMAEAARRRCAAGEQCICDVDAEWAIDGSRGGNGTQYVNHSCRPNSDVIVSQRRIFLHALREIAPGEEITTDYLYELGLERTSCNCRTRSCRETISPAGITGDSAGQASERPDRQPPYLTLLWGGACEG
jgi:SET domain-containing protein